MFWKLSSAPSFFKVHHAVTPLSTHCLNPLYSADLKLLSNTTHLRTFVSFFILYFLITLNHSSSVNVVIESILFFNPFVYFLISNKALDRIFYKLYFHVFPFSRVRILTLNTKLTMKSELLKIITCNLFYCLEFKVRNRILKSEF